MNNSHNLPWRGIRVLVTRCYLPFLLLTTAFSLRASNDTIPAGAFIINMGITPQTAGNGLKPYGMVYDLVKNYTVPIKWVINPAKLKDGIDFTYNGVDYKGGPFIVPANYRTASVNARITYWQSQGVVGVTTTSPIVVPVHTTLKAMPVWTLNSQNGGIAQGFITACGIPATAYNWLLPQQLTCCNDIFVMPHADPTWPTHSNLYSWNLNCDGAIWLACHAGSALEDMFNPANKSQQTNFLSVKTGNATGSGTYEENALVLWGNHNDGSPPYSYAYPADPFMQFMGTIDAATQNGSEQIYLPKVSWNPGAKVYVWDPSHADVPLKSPGPAGVVVSGRGFDDPNRGRVMLEASHNVGGTGPANIAAQRIFMNFSLFTANEKAVIPDISALPETMISSVPVKLTYNLPPGVDSITYTSQWTAACGGTFSPNSTSKTVYYTPPAVSSPTPCVITVQIKDACGRVFTDAKSVTIQCGFSATATATNPACNGASTGSINMTFANGSSPYTWNWSRTSPAGTGSGSGTIISGLSAGVYAISVTANGACSTTLTVTITEPPALSATANGTNVQCNGGTTGAITLTVSGGVAPYTYNWGGGVTTQNRSNLSAGTYTVTVTDANGCTKTATATVTEPSGMTITPTITHVNCFGQINGAVTLAVSGGTGPYTYAWSDGPTTQNRTNLAAGSYTVTVTDAGSCTKTALAVVTQPAAALSLSTSVTNIVCGNGTGAINLTVAGGTSPYAYLWADGPTTEDRSGLAAGNYTVTVTDNKGCTAVTSASVTATAGASLTTSVTNINCFGQKGAIDLTVTGGVGPFTYSWADGVTTEDRTNLNPGTYSVTVTSSEGCTAATSATVTGPTAALSLSATMVNINCNGNANGSIDLTVTGGTAPYTYQWSTGATTEDVTGLTAGNYAVTVTDNKGCTEVLNKTITEPLPLSLSVAPTQLTCPTDTNGAIDLTVSGGTAPYAYLWSNAATTQDLTGLGVGTYSVTVTDAGGCTATISTTLSSTNQLPTPPSGVNH